MKTTDLAEATATSRDPRRWLILIVLCLSTLVLVIDNMVLNVAIPQIATDLGASAQDIQWIIDSYILVFAGLLLTSGSLSDKFGRRLVMIIGLALFGAASVLAAFATTPELLIAGRVVMGIGGALIMPSTLSILITVFDEDERPKAIAAWSAVAVVGMVGGPVTGGLLLDHFWWGSVFVLNLPIVVLAIVAAIVLMPESKGPWRKPDLPGMVLSVVGMTALVWTIIMVPTHGLTDSGTMTAGAVAVICLAGFVIRELTTDSPMVPLGLFRNRVFTGSSFSLVLLTFANGGLLLALTQYLQFVLEYTPTETAFAFTPMAVAVLAFNGLGATLASKVGNRSITAVGLTVTAAGFGLLTLLEPTSSFWLPALAMAVMGSGFGLAMPATIGALMGAVPGEHAGVGSALNDTIQQAGAALGVAVLGAVLSSTYSDAMPADAPESGRESISDALAISTATGDTGLAAAARDAFTSGMSTTFIVAASSVLCAAALSLVLLRERKDPDAPVLESDESTEVLAESR
ncbi:MFS transporter [Nocardia amikacinitolerans]|uniref:MFS transporter n=1 Tax=Nocardia amikacinitolerans TaxID=756689 RepID=UPI0020A60B9E|nr:MFS transporter [Nocardia amikacinitolerans]MCP2292913.1 drug resistance transporter, EmrB/QacA subfamily [Nocardia amikacinitolerans]